MGMAKRAWMEQQAQGFAYSDDFVCVNCVDDEVLRGVIASASAPGESCTFCAHEVAASLDVLLEAFLVGICHEYGDADDELAPYESREGGYQIRTYDTWDLVDQFGDVLVGDGLFEAVREGLNERVWVDRDWMVSRRDVALRNAWEQFCAAVKYKTRYVFWLLDETDEEKARGYGDVPPGRVLHELAGLVHEYSLFATLDADALLWRAHGHRGSAIDGGATAARLGTGQRKHSMRPNRMSPAGIPMFYAALDAATALAEVLSHAPSEHDHFTSGAFRLTESVTVVDLTRIPPLPSVFDPERGGDARREIKFLRDFVADLQKPPTLGEEPVDYVPTQVVTEFMLQVLAKQLDLATPITGILYPSAAGTPGVAVVLDIPNESCVEVASALNVAPALILEPSTVRVAPRSG